MTIEILGSGCPKCQQLAENAKKALEELSLKDIKIEHTYDINKIIEMGVMSTSAIAINGQVKASGRIPDVKEIKK
jgi:small redox-active disulfide protein 2